MPGGAPCFRTAYEYGVHCIKNFRLMSKTSYAPSTWDRLIQPEAKSGLTRERIVSAAIAIADAHGLSAVSIRRIAAQLDASAMGLYHYVPAKRDLLNLMLDATNAEFKWPATSIDGWRELLSHFAWESRACLKRHPWVGILRAGDPEYGPECIRILEELLTSLAQFGLDVRNAIRVLGVLFVFVNGFVAAENSNERRPKGRRKDKAKHRNRRLAEGEQPVFARPVLATGKFPHVSRFIETGSELPDDEAFGRALSWILNGIAADIQGCMRSAGGMSQRYQKRLGRVSR